MASPAIQVIAEKIKCQSQMKVRIHLVIVICLCFSEGIATWMKGVQMTSFRAVLITVAQVSVRSQFRKYTFKFYFVTNLFVLIRVFCYSDNYIVEGRTGGLWHGSRTDHESRIKISFSRVRKKSN